MTNKWRPTPKKWESLKPVVQELRSSQTPAEKVLWEKLRRKQVAGLRFRRQHAIGPFVVDFYCGKAKLVIELDGSVHKIAQARDTERQTYLENLGFYILRFRNDEVFSAIEATLAMIEKTAIELCDARFEKRISPPMTGQVQGSSCEHQSTDHLWRNHLIE